METIRVHILNFHGSFSHIEILLERVDVSQYLSINRWVFIPSFWQSQGLWIRDCASSRYSFDIQADPSQIETEWHKYFRDTSLTASILGNNCAVAAQWFLTKFAAIPAPSLINASLNHLAFGIMWPSIVPCPVMLPGRVMSNAKFYMEAKNHPEVAAQYSRLYLHMCMALSVLALSASISGLMFASAIVTAAMAPALNVGCGASGLASAYCFFKARNILAAKNISDNFKKTDEHKSAEVMGSLTNAA